MSTLKTWPGGSWLHRRSSGNGSLAICTTTPSQKLALLAIAIDLLPRPQGVIGDRVKEIAERVAEIAADVHGLAYQLHPSKLEMLGLVAAINGLCRDTTRHYGVKVDFESRDVPRDIGSDVALCLYRIVQEALQNIVKHSGAGRASLRLAWGLTACWICTSPIRGAAL